MIIRWKQAADCKNYKGDTSWAYFCCLIEQFEQPACALIWRSPIGGERYRIKALQKRMNLESIMIENNS